MSTEGVLPIHPRTGLRALGFTSRGPVWPVMGGSGDGGDGGGDAGDGAPADKGSGDTGWKPPASQADLDRIISDRLARDRRANFADYDALKDKAGQFDALAAASRTDAERLADEARQDERAKVTSAATTRTVRAEFRAAAKGVLEADQLAALMEDRDLLKYADADGEPDVAKIEKLVTAFAPKKDDKRDFPDLGGGKRGAAAKTTDMNALIRKAAGR